ncbi:hypothetical protein [Candidatus Wolbachia massiliensis]|uniref:Uncharacterized protein n=1 Tax=Candidatus Wolbachia massiliensis TaxID=1845000 RepID=A0A7L7YLK6_9RICK|nr:hypothetical protein [Candidatus Wolbachia massiliensis]QOD38140.1 hypothetical protein ID128_05010 [Candidatus Wolbachia massiliensis]
MTNYGREFLGTLEEHKQRKQVIQEIYSINGVIQVVEWDPEKGGFVTRCWFPQSH